jgi:hypothetical protein
MKDDRPVPEEHHDDALAIIECTIPPELTIAEWRSRRRAARPQRLQRLRTLGSARRT